MSVTDEQLLKWGERRLNKRDRRHLEQLLAVEAHERDGAEPPHPATVRALVRGQDAIASKTKVRLTERGRKTLKRYRGDTRIALIVLDEDQHKLRNRVLDMAKLLDPDNYWRRNLRDKLTLVISGEEKGGVYTRTMISLTEDLMEAEELAREKNVEYTLRFEVDDQPKAKAKVRRQEMAADNVVEMSRWRKLRR